MKKILYFAPSLLLLGCSSVPTVAIPDGSNRVPINREIDSVKNNIDKISENSESQISELEKKIISLNSEILTLKKSLSELSKNMDLANVKISSFKDEQKIIDKNVLASLDTHLKIIDTKNFKIFRLSEAFAKTEFKVSIDEQKEILAAAFISNSPIIISGRTYADKINMADKKIAINRALNARKFLIDNGINPKKISVNYLSSGDFIANNDTEQGRALNRRVEIKISKS